MHAILDTNVGPKLQRTMRTSTNETSVIRAEIILQSGLGVPVDRLAEDYGMTVNAIRTLIVDFNVRRTKAISRKKPTRLDYQMTAEDRAILEELVRLTPQAFDLPDLRWYPEELIAFVKEHGLVRGLDESFVRNLLEANRPKRRGKII